MKLYRLLALITVLAVSVHAESIKILNVSYDPTRELYKDYNAYFIREWKKSHPKDQVRISQSHGGSGKQARAVIDGLEADVVTLALPYDIDEIAKASHKLPTNWQDKFPNYSTPFNSTIVFVVRKGNPKLIKDWSDLVKPNIQVITPNPKTSGGARWNFLAAWIYEFKRTKSEAKAAAFVGKLFKNVPVLDSGARGSTTTFIKNGLGDVLIAWENEALLITKTLNPNDYEIVNPSISVLAEPPVAIIEKNARAHVTSVYANAYLKGLYSPEGQKIGAKHFYRPTDPAIKKSFSSVFPSIKLVNTREYFKNWDAIQKKFFNDGGLFDKIYQK